MGVPLTRDAPPVSDPVRGASLREHRAYQAALYGVLHQIEALGLELVELRRLPG
jgi:hypothetical protein